MTCFSALVPRAGWPDANVGAAAEGFLGAAAHLLRLGVETVGGLGLGALRASAHVVPAGVRELEDALAQDKILFSHSVLIVYSVTS